MEVEECGFRIAECGFTILKSGGRVIRFLIFLPPESTVGHQAAQVRVIGKQGCRVDLQDLGQ